MLEPLQLESQANSTLGRIWSFRVCLSASLHAEQSAILNAWMHEEREVVTLRLGDTLWSLSPVYA